MIRNISKRRELAEMIYERYVDLTPEDKEELEDEIGGAFIGYEKALNEIRDLIESGDDTFSIMCFIKTQISD